MSVIKSSMDDMWQAFERTGRIGDYLAFKGYEQCGQNGCMNTGAIGNADENPGNSAKTAEYG